MAALTGRTVALAEGRQQEELARLIEKEGATAVRCPLLTILDVPDRSASLAWLRQLSSGQFDWLVLMTGEAWRRLLRFADDAEMREPILDACRKLRIVTRGGKPVQALKEVGLAPSLTAQPPTTDGVMAVLGKVDLRGRAVGLTLYGGPNDRLVQFLEGAGATVHTVLPYVYAPAADADRVADLIARLEGGAVDAIIFTSSPQVDRLFEVAAERGIEPELLAGLARTPVAAVGPVVAKDLAHRGVRVSVCPEQGFVMKNLVTLLARALVGR